MHTYPPHPNTDLPPFSKGGTEGGFLPLLTLHTSKIRITFTAEEPRRIYGMETALRGRLGFHLKRVCCPFPDFRKRPCEGCELSANCLYLTLFAPEPRSALSGGTPPPLRPRHPVRPYVIAVDGPENKPTIETGEPGSALLTLFGPAIRYCSLFLEAGAAAIRSLGLQPADIEIQRPAALSSDENSKTTTTIAWPLSQWVGNGDHATDSVLTLQCLTPVRLVSDKKALSETVNVAFIHFVKAALRRLRDLKRAYGEDRHMGGTDRRFYQTAEAVTVKENRLYWGLRKRRSHSQGQDVFLNGLKGGITFEGELQPFVPLLKAAEIVHLGKGTSAGNGRIRLDLT